VNAMVHWMGQEYQMAVKLVGPDTAKQRNSKGEPGMYGPPPNCKGKEKR
jgi:hypothetical protein